MPEHLQAARLCRNARFIKPEPALHLYFFHPCDTQLTLTSRPTHASRRTRPPAGTIENVGKSLRSCGVPDSPPACLCSAKVEEQVNARRATDKKQDLYALLGLKDLLMPPTNSACLPEDSPSAPTPGQGLCQCRGTPREGTVWKSTSSSSWYASGPAPLPCPVPQRELICGGIGWHSGVQFSSTNHSHAAEVSSTRVFTRPL
jgi:hypothetical protein